MKISYSWLKELSGVDWPVDDMERRLTAAGTAGVAHKINPEFFRQVVVGHITRVEPHPNADKLKVTEVDTGDATHTIICGAPNCAVGQKAVVALPGANLKGEFPVREITMRGVASAGMICAEDELGLSDDHSGIIVLDDEAPVGAPVFDYLKLDDAIFDFEITPNRPDCLSAVGIAREMAVLAGKDFAVTPVTVPEISEPASDYISIVTDDPDACPRYAARIIRNITIGESPWWMRKRLIDCGVRPINNIVDITNYVMLETGHPLHAFDYDRFGSKEVVVRRAVPGELFITLDGQKHELDSEVLLITNGRQGVAAAGVMGGLESEVTAETRTILLESAYFNPSVIRRSSQRLSLASESSYRFERGMDPNGVIHAADRAAALMAELTGGDVLAGVVDTYAKKITPVTIDLRRSRVTRLLGIEIPEDFIENAFRGLGMGVVTGETCRVTVPTFRPDITREVDLIEEIARLYGLEKIPVGRYNAGPLYTPRHRRHSIKEDLRRILTGLGFEEALGTGFAHTGRMAKVDATHEPIKVLNPLSDEFGVMRTRILYALLVYGGNNIRHRNIDVRLFEIGKIYLRNETAAEGPQFPDEPEYVGFFMTGLPRDLNWKSKPGTADLFEIKGVMAALAEALRLGEISLRPEAVAGYDKACSFAVVAGEQAIGHMGRVDRRVARLFDIKQECYAAELKLEDLIAVDRGLVPFAPLPKYPASSRDIALIVDGTVPAGNVYREIIAAGGDLVESVSVFDLFTGEPVPEGKKSLAFAVSFRSPERTLEDKEVDQAHKRIVAHLEQKFNARLRE